MAVWRKAIFRIIALANFVMIAAGSYLLFESVLSVPRHLELEGLHVDVLHFYLMVLANLCFLTALTFGSVELLRLKRRGVAICSIIFISELGYWLLELSVGSLAVVVGNIGLSPQMIFYYPIFGLLALYAASDGRVVR